MRNFCSLYKKCRRKNVATTTLDCFIEYTDEPTSEPKTAKKSPSARYTSWLIIIFAANKNNLFTEEIIHFPFSRDLFIRGNLT